MREGNRVDYNWKEESSAPSSSISWMFIFQGLFGNVNSMPVALAGMALCEGLQAPE